MSNSGAIREKTKLSSSVHNFPIVGIGASAGGLDAFKQLLSAIPIDSEMAYVLVQHLNAAHESKLTEILAKFSKIPIEVITDEVKILPNHIYVMPSGKVLTSANGVLKLTPRDNLKTNLVIDIFFSSIAVVWESMAVGVVLSGTGVDGTTGLKMIKEHGGITIVQDDAAAYVDMPQSAVSAGVVDFILPVEKIPAQLIMINNVYRSALSKGDRETMSQNDEFVFKQMMQVLQQRSGVDFTFYKQSTVRRRIGRRMTMHKKEKLADYLKILRTSKAEQDALFQDMLIPVTSFFRDPKTFETLTEKVFPALLKNKSGDDAIRLWVAGCSTGEEVYSIAICLNEFLGKNPSGKKIQIFGSDISEPAIKKARAGLYSKAELQTVSEERLCNYFTKIESRYQVNKSIRDLCVFANHNFLKDPPFAKLDLVSCRNVLIYMDSFLQTRALSTFHYALKEQGILLLGKSETVSAATDLFGSFNKHDKLYTRKAGAGRYTLVASEQRAESMALNNNKAQAKETQQTDFRKSAETVLISKSPASVIVNEQMDIVHIHGDITAFLKPSPGKPSFNLLKMAREGLSFELRSSLHKAKAGEPTVVKEEIPVKAGTKEYDVTIEVVPLRNTVEPHYLILFTKIDLETLSAKRDASSSATKLKNDEAIKRNEQLEKELANTRENMRSITEDMEAANEELQSANEELQSSNEEMQSLNEELETSKEELQSGNEELIILNNELIDKQEQLNAARYYSEAIVTTIREPLLVLDKNLRIKSANNSFYNKFRLSDQEIEGRFFYELQDRQWNNIELRSQLETILPQKNRIENFEIIIDRRNLLLNARQVLNDKYTEELILVSIDDVSDSVLNKQLQISEAQLAQERQLFYDSFMHAPAGVAILQGPDLTFEFVNSEYEILADRKITLGKTVQQHFPEIEQKGYIELLKKVMATGETFSSNELPLTLTNKDDGTTQQRFINLVLEPLKNANGVSERLLAHVLDVTTQVETRKKIEAEELFNRTVLENSPDCFKVLDRAGRIQYMNYNGLCQMEFDDVEQLKNKNWKVLWGRENEALADAAIDKAILGETTQFIASCPTSTGAIKWWDVMVSPVGKPGEIVQQIIAVSRDITEQRKVEEAVEKMAAHLKLATNSANVGTWSYDLQTQSLDWNTLHKKMWGYHAHFRDLSYQDWHTPILPADREKVFNQIEASRINHTDYDVTYRISRADDHAIRSIRSFGKYHYNGKGDAETLTGISIDITEQQAVEEKIKQSEAQFKMLSETIPHMVWTATADGKKNFFNKYFLEYTGLPYDELKGDGWQQIIFKDDLKKELQRWTQTLKTGEDFKIEKRIRHRDGTYRWHLSHGIAQKNAEGTITGWIGTSTEIDEQKKFTAALEAKVKERTFELHVQNETFKQAEESSMQGSYSFNLTTGQLVYSDNLFKLIGYQPSEFEPSIEEFNKHVHPDDQALVQAAADQVMANKTADEWYYRMITKTGEIIHVKGTGRIIALADEQLLVGTLQNITKDVLAAETLVEKENYLDQIIANAPDAVIVINDKSEITLWNPRTEEIFGWKSYEVLGKYLHDIIVPTYYREAHCAGMKHFLDTGEAKILNKTLELSALHKDGKEFPISLTISHTVQQGKKLFIAFLRDITLEKQNKEELIVKTSQLEVMNQALEIKNKELENSNDELASFSYVASHDLQEPLRKIQTFGKRILESEQFSEKTQDYFNRIIAAGERMQNLIIALLDFSRTNTTQIILAPVDLNTVVEESKNDLHLSILEKHATVEHQKLPTVNGMHIQLSQLFTNLIDNALKYSHPEINPHITITSQIIEGKNIEHPAARNQHQYHEIKIADNGIGFEKEYSTKIFELFQRLHNKNEYSGTGIGLAIVKKIATNHDGFITADSAPNQGATFTIYLPTQSTEHG